MKRIIILWVCVLWAHYVNAQIQYENGFKDVMTADTTLNNFMTHWMRKPYKLGGSTERGIDCSQFTK